MNRTKIQSLLAIAVGIALPALSWADLTNTASVTYRDASANSYTATSNTVNVTVSVVPVITLTKSANPTSAISGGTVTFTIQYQNTTTGTATNVVITDVIPTGSTLVTGTISNGGTLTGNTITWTVGTVAGNGTGSVSFQARVN